MANDKVSVTDLKQVFAGRADNLNKLVAPPAKKDVADPALIKSLNSFSSANALLNKDLSSLKSSLDKLVVALTPVKSYKAKVDQQSITNDLLKKMINDENKSSANVKSKGILGSVAGGVGSFIGSLTPLKVLGIGGLIGLLLNGDIGNFGKGLSAAASTGISGLAGFITTGDTKYLTSMLGKMKDSFTNAIPNKGMLGWLVHGDSKGFLDGIMSIAGIGGSFGKGLITGDWTDFGKNLTDLPKMMGQIWGSLGDQAKFAVTGSVAIGLGKIIAPMVLKAWDRNKELSILTQIAINTGGMKNTGGGVTPGGGGVTPGGTPSSAAQRAEKRLDKALKSGNQKAIDKAEKAMIELSKKEMAAAAGSRTVLNKMGGMVKGKGGLVGGLLTAAILLPTLLDANTSMVDKIGASGGAAGAIGGGWAGMAGGAAAGGAIGALFGGVGAAPGALIGGLIGGLGGGMLGDFLGTKGATALANTVIPQPQSNQTTSSSNGFYVNAYNMLKSHEGSGSTAKLENNGTGGKTGTLRVIGHGHAFEPSDPDKRYVTLFGKKYDLMTANLTMAEQDELLKQDYNIYYKRAEKFKGWSNLNDIQKQGVLDITYQTGNVNRQEFAGLSDAVAEGDVGKIKQILDVKNPWYREAGGKRVDKVIGMLTNGMDNTSTPSNSSINTEVADASGNKIELGSGTMGIFEKLFEKFDIGGDKMVTQVLGATGVFG